MADDRQAVLEAALAEGEASEEASPDAPLEVKRCEACGQAIDDVQTMDEVALLQHLRLELLRDFTRKSRDGQLTHQEAAVASRLILANLDKVREPPPPPPRDEHLPPAQETALPERSREHFTDTDGG